MAISCFEDKQTEMLQKIVEKLKFLDKNSE